VSLLLSRIILLFSAELRPTIESILNVSLGFDGFVVTLSAVVVAVVMWPIDGNDICGAKGIIALVFGVGSFDNFVNQS